MFVNMIVLLTTACNMQMACCSLEGDAALRCDDGHVQLAIRSCTRGVEHAAAGPLLQQAPLCIGHCAQSTVGGLWVCSGCLQRNLGLLYAKGPWLRCNYSRSSGAYMIAISMCHVCELMRCPEFAGAVDVAPQAVKTDVQWSKYHS